MLGILTPCLRGADRDVVDLWRAHMCGACLTLRDRHWQVARATLNTDAIAASVLLEAQQAVPDMRVRAGRAALRGMRPAQVIPAEALSVRLAATTSLTLAAAKATDEVGEAALALSGRSRLRTSVARGVAGPLRRGASRDLAVGDALDTAAVITGVAGQAAVEQASTDIDEITAATEHACAAVFAATADLADRPENRAALARIGAAFGRCGHLLDAVEDLATDRDSGAYNLIDATGVTIDELEAECLRLHRTIAEEIDGLGLRDDRLARALVVRGLRHSITDTFAGRSTGSRSNTRTVRGYRTLGAIGVALCVVGPQTPAADESEDGWCTSFRKQCCDCADCCDCGDCCDCCDCCDCS
ncbi:hypothetical protein ASG12_10215 [Williamsia sp. Leaf354]|uniref:DUF5685 family protein n=1 Tax=Williamsia sp. Leaf354 TaxID=1736349 RepID=UPI0006F435D4|nr:DUF5685 family protein [Williamsia sp. Leaf354]KQR98748.1 hypothetical protein ASG12_10215 [Williamsia sp. Leaf354]